MKILPVFALIVFISYNYIEVIKVNKISTSNSNQQTFQQQQEKQAYYFDLLKNERLFTVNNNDDEEINLEELIRLNSTQLKRIVEEKNNLASLTEFEITNTTTTAAAEETAATIKSNHVYGKENVTLNENELLAFIVIQVHTRVLYMKSLIDSLRSVNGINQTVLIFSHDYYHPLINDLIQEINFTNFIQIYYPYSLQLYPNKFPGNDPNDCPRDISKVKAKQINCTNIKYPDSYGHYREARYTQTKHHWFWKLNYIFEQLQSTKYYDGYFVFLEEDHYASPDMLYMLKMITNTKNISCPQCEVIALGVYSDLNNYGPNCNRIEKTKWISSKHNMGFAINRTTYERIKKCAKHFCEYDDYNWDWSLQRISEKCFPTPMLTLAVTSPRVFHIGECGVHHKSKECIKNKLVKKVRQTISNSRKYLFPKQLLLLRSTKRNFKMPKVNGGWGDKRDHSLCKSFATQPL